jgi:hypothetical protein
MFKIANFALHLGSYSQFSDQMLYGSVMGQLAAVVCSSYSCACFALFDASIVGSTQLWD